MAEQEILGPQNAGRPPSTREREILKVLAAGGNLESPSAAGVTRRRFRLTTKDGTTDSFVGRLTISQMTAQTWLFEKTDGAGLGITLGGFSAIGKDKP